MGRGWTVTAAVLAFLHAGTSLLGATGLGMTADQADPVSTDEALMIAAVIAVMALALFVTAILLLVGHPLPVLAVTCVSLAISAYVGLRWAGEPGAYQIPLIFAVLPAAVAAIVGVQLGRRRAGAVTA